LLRSVSISSFVTVPFANSKNGGSTPLARRQLSSLNAFSCTECSRPHMTHASINDVC